MCVTMWKSNCSFLVWVYLACNSWQPVLGCVDHSPVDVRESLCRGVAVSALSVPSCCVRVIYGLSMTGIAAVFALYCLNSTVQSFYFEPIF